MNRIHCRISYHPRSTCVMVEDIVASFGDLVAGKAGVVHRLVGGFPIVKLSVSPAARRSVFSGVLDHELDPVLGWTGDVRLGMAKCLAAFAQRVVTPGEPGDDRAVREWKLPFARGIDGDFIA